jgi:hypothetical protein
MLKFLLGDSGSVLPLLVLVGGVASFLVIAFYLISDGRSAHRRRMESLPLDAEHEGASRPLETKSSNATKCQTATFGCGSAALEGDQHA